MKPLFDEMPLPRHPLPWLLQFEPLVFVAGTLRPVAAHVGLRRAGKEPGRS